MRAQELVEQLLSRSRTDGCTVIVTERSSVNLRWAANALTTNGMARDLEVTVIALVGEYPSTKSGSVTRTGITADDLDALMAEAERAARAAPPAVDAQLPWGHRPPSADWAQETSHTDASVFAGFAPALGGMFDSSRSAHRELFGYAEHSITTTYLGTLSGLRLRYEDPSGRVEFTGKSHNRSRSTWVGQSTSSFKDLDLEQLEGEIAQRLAWQARRVDVEPGRHPTVLSPSALADLMIYLYWSMGGQDAAEGRNAFAGSGGHTRVGETLTPRALTLRSDPRHPGLETIPFVATAASSPLESVFDNGAPILGVDWIHDGRLAALQQTRHTSTLTGQPYTQGGGNLILTDRQGVGSLNEVVSRTEYGLLVNCLWYIREVDPQSLLLTGLTRDGVYLIEGGEVVGVASNFRFNESPIDLLRRLVDVGSTSTVLPREWADWFTRVAMPPVRVDAFNMSTLAPGT